MTTAVQHRRGTTAEHSTFTGLEGEVTIDTTKDTAVIHDGALAGGYPLAKETLSNANPSGLGALTGASTASDDQFVIYDTSVSQLKKISRAELNNAITAEPFDTVDINGGTIDGTVIGGSSAAAGTFTSVNSTTAVSSTSLTTPLVIGGTTTTSALSLRSTSGVGTTGADIIFQTGNNGATEAMRVLNSGFVGIGTNAPSQKLTIGTGDLQIDNAQYVRGKLLAGTTTRMLGINASNLLYIGSIDAALSGIIFNVNGTAYAQFDASGNLGIGTASPGTKLEVSGAAKANYAIASGPLAAYASSSGGLYSYFAATAGTLNAVTDNSGTAGTLILATGSERVRITSTGNVGINVASPETKLHVTSAASSAGLGTNGILTLQNTNGDTFDRRAELLFKHLAQTVTAISSSYTGFAAGPQYAGDLIFATKATTDAAIVERMRITSAGNVGIGTTTPVNALQVNGSFGRNAPVTKAASFTLAATENWLICNGTATITVTLPAASSWTGREVMIKNIAAFTVVSASSNVVPLVGGAAGTAILAATAGKFATLVSDGTNWIIMQGN